MAEGEGLGKVAGAASYAAGSYYNMLQPVLPQLKRRRPIMPPTGSSLWPSTSSVGDQDRKGQEKVYELRYGAEPIRPPGREEELHLVVVAGFGEEPHQPFASARLVIALVDRANLSHPVKN